jgi:hypothetical protein
VLWRVPSVYDEDGNNINVKHGKPTLLNLELDFTNAYCPLGCCRIIVDIAPLLAEMQPANVTLLGLRNEGERQDLLEEVKIYSGPMDVGEPYRHLAEREIVKMHNMVFDPEEDVWAEWCM